MADKSNITSAAAAKDTGSSDRMVDATSLPTSMVNRVVGLGYFGSLFDCILAESRTGFDTSGKPEGQGVIVARLRFDLDFARSFHAQLGRAIDAHTETQKR